MYFCVYCGKSFEGNMKFCPYCGKPQPNLQEPEPAATVPQPPVYEAPAQPPHYGEPVVVYAPPSEPHTAYSDPSQQPMNNSAKIFGNLSFFLGLAGLCAGVLTILLLLLYFAIDFDMTFSLELISLPLGVAAIVFSVIARKKGNMLSRPKLGRIFGIIALVLTVVSIILLSLYTREVVSEFFEDMPDFSL